MSEPSSLYMRVHLTAGNLEAFQSSRLRAPSSYSDWLAWLRTRTFYGEITASDIERMDPARDAGAPEIQSVGEYLALLCQDPTASPSQTHYDPATQTWTLCVMQLSENYNDLIVALSILRGVSAYKDLPGDDFILIYPYLWVDHPGDFANAYVTIAPGRSQLAHAIPADSVREADQHLGDVLDAFRRSFPDDML